MNYYLSKKKNSKPTELFEIINFIPTNPKHEKTQSPDPSVSLCNNASLKAIRQSPEPTHLGQKLGRK
jgi:hypothetical protein